MARSIYLIRSGLMDAVKIGVSDDPFKRLQQLQTASPDRLVLLGSIPGDVTEERELHRRFADRRLSGEWFRLSEDDIAEIKGGGAFQGPARDAVSVADFIIDDDLEPWVRIDRAGFHHMYAFADGLPMFSENGMVYLRLDDVIAWHAEPSNVTHWDVEMFQAARGILGKARRGEMGRKCDVLVRM